MNISTRLKQLREERGLSQAEIAKIMGVGRTTYLKWETGENKPTRKLNQLSNFFNVSVDYLLGKTNLRKAVTGKAFNSGVKIPVLQHITSAKPFANTQNILNYEEITLELASTGDFFALIVTNEVMSPKLEIGDVLIVKKQTSLETDEVAVLFVPGEKEATIQKIRKVDGGILLYGYNIENYPPKFYSHTQLETQPLRILGKVIESRHPW